MSTQGFTLGRLRLAVQLIALVVLLYGGSVLGHYMADMLSGALPALACAYDEQTSDYCVLIPTQHQLHHRVGEAIVRLQGFAFDMVVPLLFTLLNFFLLFMVLNKAFCGWICPLGTVQELLYRAGRWLKRPLRSLRPHQVGRVRPFKWLLLLGLVMVLPLATGLGLAPHAAGDAFCQICPSRVISTLATGSSEQLAVNTSGWADAAFGAVRAFLVGFIVIAALAVRQPFCRICPMLALHALFRRLSLTRLVKTEKDRCENCGICTRACPMDIPEIWTRHGAKAFSEDCTLCGRCAEYCPEPGAISIKIGPVTAFTSSRDYYKLRIKHEKPSGDPVRRVPRKPEPSR